MTWDGARKMAEEGAEIGSHSLSHARLGSLKPDEARREIEESATLIASHTGRLCRFFSYPYGLNGGFLEEHCRLLGAASYEAAFTQRTALNDRDSNPFRLSRIDLPGDCRLDRFRYYERGVRVIARSAGSSAS